MTEFEKKRAEACQINKRPVVWVCAKKPSGMWAHFDELGHEMEACDKPTESQYIEELIKEIAELRKQRDAKQVNHEFACTVFASGPCTCGFSGLMQGWAITKAENKALRQDCLRTGEQWQTVCDDWKRKAGEAEAEHNAYLEKEASKWADSSKRWEHIYATQHVNIERLERELAEAQTALAAWKADYGDVDGCYCHQLVSPGKCANCLTRVALAKMPTGEPR